MSKQRGHRATYQGKRPRKQFLSFVDLSEGIPWKRIFAYAIDWVCGGVFISFPAVVVYGAISGGSGEVFPDLYVFGAQGYPLWWAYVCCALSLAMFFIYYVVIPYRVWPGQTLGKRVMGQRIVSVHAAVLASSSLAAQAAEKNAQVESSSTGAATTAAPAAPTPFAAPSLRTLLLRHGVGLLLIEGASTLMTGYLIQCLTLTTSWYWDTILYVIAYSVTLVSAVLVFAVRGQLAIHDRLAGTRVEAIPADELAAMAAAKEAAAEAEREFFAAQRAEKDARKERRKANKGNSGTGSGSDAALPGNTLPNAS
jgi:hypothetical protein